MALWSKPKVKPRALTAAGQRIVPETAAAIGSRRGDWQRLAWAYRTSVPELRYVGGFVNTQVSRVRWFVAEAGPDGLQPRKLNGEPPAEGQPESEVSLRTQRIAIDALERLDLNSRGSAMAGRGAENFEYAGECYLLGEANALGIEEWSIRSVSEVKVSRDGQVQLVEPGKNSGRVLNLDEVELFRLWNPDPEYLEWADAKITACLGVLEEIVIYDRQARAAARSRIASGALLYVPEELSLTRPGSAPVDVSAPGVDDEEDLFMSELTAGMLTPISSDEDPSAIVPLVVRGPAMGPEGRAMKDLIGAIQIPREEVSDLIAKRDAAVIKLAHGMDFPPEIITGIGDANHWAGFLVSDATIKNHLEPRCENFADAVTAAYLRTVCLAAGCPPMEVARLCVWFDASELSQPADPMANAKELWDRNAISNQELRRAAGYEEKDAPDDKEWLIRMLVQGRTYEASIPIVFALSGVDASDPAIAQAIELARQATAKDQPGGNLPNPPRVIEQRPSEATSTQSKPVPDGVIAKTTREQVPGVRASAAPVVNERLCRQLGQVDSKLVAELGGFIDAAILDIVRQAANRIRSGAQRKDAPAQEKAMFASAAPGMDAVGVVAAAGPSQRWTVPDEIALEGSLDRIKPRWLTSIGAAARRVSDILKKLLGRSPQADLVQEYLTRANEAWPQLAEHIRETAVKVLHGENDRARDDGGPVLPRSALTEALTFVGGPLHGVLGVDESGLPNPVVPATGLAAGQVVTDEVENAGGSVVSREWVWHGRTRDPFQSHFDLDGVEFQSWKDPNLAVRPGDEWIGSHYFPKDHAGCGCHVALRIGVAATDGQQ